MRFIPFLIVPLFLTGCATEPDDAESTSALAAGQVSCIDVSRIAGRRAEGDRALIFELNDGRTFRNDLDEACPGAARASNFGTLAIDPMESRMCRGDSVRVYDPADLPVGGIKGVPRCRLGAFTEVPRQ
jgi:hypothetical protein